MLSKLTLLSSRVHNNTIKSNSYDQFLFVDSLTNRSIAVRDMRHNQCNISKKKSKVRHSSTIELKELDECIAMLKSTSSFQKQNLREKLFAKSGQEEIPYTDQSSRQTIKKRRLIRQIIKGTLARRNRQQLEKYLTDPQHRLDRELLELVKHDNIPICKQNVKNIMGALDAKQEKQIMKRKRRLHDFQKDPFVQKLTQLEKEMNRELKQRLRKAGLALVENKEQSKKVTNHIRKVNKTKTTIERRQSHDLIQSIKWQTPSLQNSQIKRKPRMHRWNNFYNSKYERSIEELFRIIRVGDLEDVQIAVAKSPKDSLKSRDEKGNSLLHLCAELNRGSLFQWLLRQRGVESLLEKNADGQTPVCIASRMEHRQVLKHIPRSLI